MNNLQTTDQINILKLGNAYELIKDIPDNSIDLIITDPPYQIDSLTGGTIDLDNPS